jgi:hypothetical protein
MNLSFRLACLLLACGPAQAKDDGLAVRHHQGLTFAYQLAIAADCADVSQAAGKRAERLTKGDAGVLEEQNNLFLPKFEPVARDPIRPQGPCLS